MDRCRSANEWREQFVQFGGVYDAHCGGLDQLMNRFFFGNQKKNPAKAGFSLKLKENQSGKTLEKKL